MDTELNGQALEAIKQYCDIMEQWDMRRYKYPYNEEDFVTFLDSKITNKEALYMFFKIYSTKIRNDDNLMRTLGNRQLTNKYLRLMIMEFKLSNYFD